MSNITQKLIVTVKEHQKKILAEQLELEAVLEKEGYIIRNNENGLGVYGRYGIHPDYYEQWRDETCQNFPEFAVIRIW